MEAKNLAEADGLPLIEWSRVDREIKERLDDWDPGAPDRPTCTRKARNLARNTRVAR